MIGRWAAAGAGLMLLFSFACGSGGAETPKQTAGGVSVVVATVDGQPTAKPRRTPEPSPTPTPTPIQVCGANPDPASPKVLQVEEPKPNQQVNIPIHVRGWGANIGFQNQGVALAVVDAKQTVLQVLDLPPQPRTFRVAPPGLEITDNTKPFAADVVVANITEPTPVCLWVYQETTASGQPKGVVQVPLMVVP